MAEGFDTKSGLPAKTSMDACDVSHLAAHQDAKTCVATGFNPRFATELMPCRRRVTPSWPSWSLDGGPPAPPPR